MEQQAIIFIPFFCMFILTFSVWIYMYAVRLSYIRSNRIKTSEIATPEAMSRLLPDKVNNPSNNLRNLFELPVLFYVLCIYLYITSQVDNVFVFSAYVFVFLRAAHSIVHCSSNYVPLRFSFYFLSALVLWFMVFRALVIYFNM